MITILEADKEIYYSAIPREEEGMGICAGAYLGNKLTMYYDAKYRNW